MTDAHRQRLLLPVLVFLGTVVAVENFGAGDLLEIADETGRRSLIPFKPGIADLEDGRIVLDPEFLA